MTRVLCCNIELIEWRKVRVMRSRCVIPAVLFSAVIVAGAANAQTASQAPQFRSPDVIFVPTPPEVVEAMLKLAKVGPNDVVYDLGSGDGRIPIAAVQTFNAKSAVGIDIDPQRIREASENLKKAGVGDRVRFLNQDLFTTPIGEATVVTLYLLQSLNEKLIPKLRKELKPGSRVVSQTFSMGSQWPADQTIQVEGRTTVYLWMIK
jgi:precorrin-6B methylase 2